MKKLISTIFAIFMVFSLMSINVFAEETSDIIDINECKYVYSNGNFKVTFTTSTDEDLGGLIDNYETMKIESTGSYAINKIELTVGLYSNNSGFIRKTKGTLSGNTSGSTLITCSEINDDEVLFDMTEGQLWIKQVKIYYSSKTTQTLTFADSSIIKTYGDAKFTNTLSGDKTTITYSSSDSTVASIDSSTGEVTILKAGTTTITASAAENDTYAAAEKTYTLTVGQKELEVTGAAANGKTYDGTTTAVIGILGTLTGVVKNDDVDIDTRTATFADKNAGNGKDVTIQYTLKGNDKDNYTIKSSTTSADIEKKEIKITADDKSSCVGSDLVNLTYTRDPSTTLCGTDTLSGELSTDANKDVVGTYSIIQNSNNPLTAGNNYTIKFAAGNYTVTANDAQTLTFTDSTITKNNGDANFTQTVTGANTTVTYTSSDETVATVNSSTGEVKIEGHGKATITATAAVDATYASASTSYTLVVRPKVNSNKSNVNVNGNKLSTSLTKGNTSNINIDLDMEIVDDLDIKPGHVFLDSNQDGTYSNANEYAGIQIFKGQNEVDPSNFVITKGSIKISLKKEYLDTLSVGTHDYQISIKDNSDSTYTYDLSVTIKNTSSSNNSSNHVVVNTSVKATNNYSLRFVSLLSLVTIAGLVALKKRKH